MFADCRRFESACIAGIEDNPTINTNRKATKVAVEGNLLLNGLSRIFRDLLLIQVASIKRAREVNSTMAGRKIGAMKNSSAPIGLIVLGPLMLMESMGFTDWVSPDHPLKT